MKCSFGISKFLEEISSLSNSIVFLYFFVLITEEGFLMSPWNFSFFGTLYSNGYIVPFLLCLLVLFFSQLFVRPPQKTILPFCVSSFGEGSWWLLPIQCHKLPPIILQIIWRFELRFKQGSPLQLLIDLLILCSYLFLFLCWRKSIWELPAYTEDV